MSPASLFWVGGEINAQIEHAAARHGHPEAKAPGEKAVSEEKKRHRGSHTQNGNNRRNDRTTGIAGPLTLVLPESGHTEVIHMDGTQATLRRLAWVETL